MQEGGSLLTARKLPTPNALGQSTPPVKPPAGFVPVAVAESPANYAPIPRALTLGNAVVGLVLACLIVLSMIGGVAFSTNNRITGLEYSQLSHATAFEQVVKLEDRMKIVEYQNQVSINDRGAMHLQMDRQDQDKQTISIQLGRLEAQVQILINRGKP
jgi:hypothetical protein